MNSIVLVFAAALAVAQAGLLAHSGVVAHSVLAGARTTHLQGPSASATVIGNDGHGIVGHAPGGSIVATEQVGGAAVGYSAPVVAHHAAYAAPAVVAHAAPVVAHHGIHGYAAPAVVAHHGIHAYAAPAVVAHHGISAYAGHHGLVHAYAAGSGIEGQWVPDYTEKLFDDGSYKGEYYH